MPEIGLLHSGRHDQVVVAEFDRLTGRPPRQHLVPAGVDAGHLGQDAFNVPVPAQHVPQRRGDLALGQDPGRALVQQGLEQVVLAPVDEGDLDRGTAQGPGGEQPGESAADDHHTALAMLVAHEASGEPAGSYQLSRSGSSRVASPGPQLPRA